MKIRNFEFLDFPDKFWICKNCFCRWSGNNQFNPNTTGGRSQFTFTVFSPFLTTHLPLVYNCLHLTNHLPIVNVYIWNLTTPNNMYLILLKEVKIFIKCALKNKIIRHFQKYNVGEDFFGMFSFLFPL